MDVTEDEVQDICTDAVFERGETYLAESRIREVHRVDATVSAVVSGSRQYDVRVDLAADGFDPWCNCPYDGPGACKHVVAVLLRCLDDIPADEGDRIDVALDDNMERVDGAYDHFSQAFTRALDGYVDCAATVNHQADGATDAVAFLEERAESGTSYLADQFERAATELQEELTTGSDGK